MNISQVHHSFFQYMCTVKLFCSRQSKISARIGPEIKICREYFKPKDEVEKYYGNKYNQYEDED